MNETRGIGQIRSLDEARGEGSRRHVVDEVESDAAAMIEFLERAEKRIESFNFRFLGRAENPTTCRPPSTDVKLAEKPSHMETMQDVGRVYNLLKEALNAQLERLETIA